jgi:ribonuclease PH
MRTDGRSNDQLRPIRITRAFTAAPAGSVLWQQGGTIVLATASLVREVPPWMRETQPGGWVTANYVMLPGSTPMRKNWPKNGHTDSRGTEIERMIGRSLRAVVDLSKIGPHTITIDCQVLQADGGTRTASICAGFAALRDAIAKLPADWREIPRMVEPKKNMQFNFGDSVNPPGEAVPARYDASFYDPKNALVDELSAVSVGVVDGEARLDLHYDDDVKANVDMNVAMTAAGKFVEFQASAENGQGFDPPMLARLTELAVFGCKQLIKIINESPAK